MYASIVRYMLQHVVLLLFCCAFQDLLVESRLVSRPERHLWLSGCFRKAECNQWVLPLYILRGNSSDLQSDVTSQGYFYQLVDQEERGPGRCARQ